MIYLAFDLYTMMIYITFTILYCQLHILNFITRFIH